MEADMQKWEYKALARGRGYKGGFSNDARDWNKKIIEALPSLGENGWELVSVVPRSSLTGESVAGFTSDELWIFKRLNE
jgi:hypothetical protein